MRNILIITLGVKALLKSLGVYRNPRVSTLVRPIVIASTKPEVGWRVLRP